MGEEVKELKSWTLMCRALEAIVTSLHFTLKIWGILSVHFKSSH